MIPVGCQGIRKNRIYVVDGTANNCLLVADLKDGRRARQDFGAQQPDCRDGWTWPARSTSPR